MQPTLIWIHAQGLDPDGLLRKMGLFPSLSDLLRRGSMGFLELSSVAEADVAESSAIHGRSALELPWEPGLRLAMSPHDWLDCVMGASRKVAAVTYGRGQSRYKNHRDMVENAVRVKTLSDIAQGVRELQATPRAELVYAELPFALEALYTDNSKLTTAFNETIRTLTDLADENAYVLITSTLSFCPYLNYINLQPLIERCGSKIVATRACAGYALVECESEAAANEVIEWFHRLITSEGNPAVAGATLHSVNKRWVVRVRAGLEMFLAMQPPPAPKAQAFYEMQERGLVLLAGKNVRKGAFLSFRTHELMKVVAALLRPAHAANNPLLAPYFGPELGPDFLADHYQVKAS